MDKIIPEIQNLFRKRRGFILYIGLAIFAAAAEGNLQKIVPFQCPCESHMVYGIAFILIPAVLLLVLGLTLDCEALCVIIPCVGYYDGDGICGTQYQEKVLMKILHVAECVGRVLSPALVWMILALFQTQYYVCAHFGPPLKTDLSAHHEVNTTDECGNKEPRDIKEQMHLQVESQALGLGILVGSLVLLSVLMVSKQCVGYKRNRLLGDHIYQYIEATAAAKRLHERATEKAEEAGRKEADDPFDQEPGKSETDYIKVITSARTMVAQKYKKHLVVPNTPISPNPGGNDCPDGSERREPGNEDHASHATIDCDADVKTAPTLHIPDPTAGQSDPKSPAAKS